MRAPARRLFAIAFAAGLGCGGGDDGGAAAPAGSISLAASPTSISLHQGASGSVTITLARSNFDDPVNVSVLGLPSGVSASVTPAQLTLATSQAQVTVDVGVAAEPGTYTITVSASAAGVGSASTTYSLVVSARPDYSLMANPLSAPINQGASATTNVLIARTNFAGDVSLSLANPPPGISAQFSPASATGNNATLTINVGSTVPIGTHTLTVVGSATGHADKTATLTITIAPRPDYDLEFSSSTLSIIAGASVQVGIDINRTNFTSAVSLTLLNPPAGISGTFSPSPAAGPSTSLTIAVAGTVASGIYLLTVAGTTAGLPDRSAVLTLTVAPKPDYTLEFSSGTVTTYSGGSGLVSVFINRTNFTGAISFALVNPPAGFSGSFDQGSTTGLTSSLTIQVANTVTPGNYTLTVRGTATGMPDRTASVTVSVVSADYNLSVSPTTISIAPGRGALVTVNINRVNFLLPIGLTVSNPPPGFAFDFPSGGAGSSSLLIVDVAPGTALGSYPITVTGSGGGLPSRTATFTVTVAVPPPLPDYTLTFSPNAVTVAAGSSTQATLQIGRILGFAGPISLTMTAAPTGVTSSFSPAVVTGNSSVVTITAAANMLPGTHFITVHASSSAGDHQVNLDVTVLANPNPPPPPPPDATFSLSSLLTVTASAGSFGNLPIFISRTNFSNVPINLTLESAPAGVTGTFTPAAPTGLSSTLQVDVSPSVVPGTYPLTIRGDALGMTSTRQASLIVTPAGSWALSVPSPRSVGQMTTALIPVTITRTGFTAPVTLSLENAPPGMTGFFGINPANGTSSLLNLTVGVNVPAASYTLTIRGKSQGQADQTVSLQVDVFVNFTLSASPGSSPNGLLIYPGGTGTSTITLNRGNFVGDIQLSFYNPVPQATPPLITAVLSPTVLSGSATTATLTLTSLPTRTGGTNFVVSGQSGSVISQTMVDVVSQWTQFLRFPTVTPNLVTVSPGSSASATFTVLRDIYVGPFSIVVTGAPAGMTVSANPQPVPGGSSVGSTSATLTINVGASVPVGIYTLTATTGATGVLSDSTTFQVEVKP